MSEQPKQNEDNDRATDNDTPTVEEDLGIFFKLPPELRIQVYNYVLVRPDREIEVVPTIHKKLSPEAKRRRVMNLNRQAKDGLAANERAQMPVSIKSALLCANKQISSEASDVLHGSHNFSFRTAQALDHFLVNIGDNKQHLRHVEMEAFVRMRNLRAIGRISDNLVEAKKLRCFKLQLGLMSTRHRYGVMGHLRGYVMSDGNDVYSSIDGLASVARKLLLALRNTQDSNDKIAAVLAIFQLEGSVTLGSLERHDRAADEQLSVAWRTAVEHWINKTDK